MKPSNSSSVKNPQILVIEDDPDALYITNEYLQSIGHSVLTASSGEEALAILQNEPKSNWILVTDLQLGRMSGKELLERLVKTGVLVLGAVVISSHLRLGEMIHSTRSGYQILGIPVIALYKPCPMRNLSLAIAEIWAAALRTTRLGPLRSVTHLYTDDPSRILLEARSIVAVEPLELVKAVSRSGEPLTLERYLVLESDKASADRMTSSEWRALCAVLELDPEVLANGYDARIHLEGIRGAIKRESFVFPVSSDLRSRLVLLEQIENCAALSSKTGRLS